MRITKEVPDKEIKLSHGDHIKIYVKPTRIEFDCFIDGVGNSFSLTKEELKEMLNAK
jgi:hypothetical protein